MLSEEERTAMWITAADANVGNGFGMAILAYSSAIERAVLERAAEVCDAKFKLRAEAGFPREASTARALRDALAARVAELEPDAGRYRWLRDASLDHRIDPPVATLIPSRGIKVSIQYPGAGKCMPECILSGVSLDAAIDAAREVKT